MKKILFLLVLSFFAFVVDSSACDCDGEELPLEESLTKSKTVFLGKLVSVKEYKPIIKHEWKRYYIFEFQPEEIFKGEKTKTISLIAEGTDCGGEFLKSNSYLVFTFWNEREKKLEYHQCFRMSLPKQSAKEEIKNLKTKN